MKFFKVSVLLVSLILFACASSTKRGDKAFNLMSFQEVELSNGLKVLLIPDNSLPYFSLVMLVGAGSINDKDGKEGAASLVSELLDKGTVKRSALEIADELGQIGADVSASASKDYAFVTGSSLSMHQEKLLDNFVEILTQPTFKDAELERAKKKYLAALQQTADDPASFASLVFEDYLYESHPYGRRSSGNKKSLKSIRQRDIIRFYLRYYRPNNARLAVVGKFDPATMKQTLDKKFKDWQSAEVPEPSFPSFPPIKGLNIELVDKADLAQTQIRMGHEGIKRTNPDFIPLRVANTILGGAFSSRLMSEIRVKRGLTYGVSSDFDARKDIGPFTVSTFTRHDKVGETVQVAIDVLENFKSQGVTKQEVEDTKSLLKGIFPRALETPEKLAQNLLLLRHYGVPDSYLETYLDKIDDIDVSDVNEVIKKYIKPENMKILVFSSKDEVKGQLEPIGTVKTKSYQEAL